MNKQYAFWIIAVVMLLGGCLPFKGESGRRFDDVTLLGIIPEKTGKDDLYTLCGWPSVIMLPEETASIRIVPHVAATPFPHVAVTPLSRGGYRVDTAAHFELFARRRTLGKVHQIVYYEHLKSRFYPWMLMIMNYSYGWATADRLWVLVNEETGLVEDYAYKKHGESMVFAGDAPSLPR